MDQPTATVLAAIIALTGVLAGLFIGLRRWRHERRDSQTAEFAKERQRAYRELWSTVEGLSVDLRTETLTGEVLRDRIRQVNAQLLKAGLYIDDEDRRMATSYMEAVQHFHRVVTSSEDPEARVSFGDTEAIPPGAIQRVKELGQAQARAMSSREKLIRRIREVLTTEETIV